MHHEDCELCQKACGRIPGVVLESRHFAAVPSLGALMPGHVLLIPKSHLIRLAAIPERLAEEYRFFQHRTVRILERVFGFPVHRFEHGSDAAATHTPCTVQHAHLHLLPTDADVLDRLGDFPWQTVGPEVRDAVGDAEYLFYQPPHGSALVARGGTFPSQHLRRVFAEALGVPEWNWRRDHRAAVVRETYDRLSAAKIRA